MALDQNGKKTLWISILGGLVLVLVLFLVGSIRSSKGLRDRNRLLEQYRSEAEARIAEQDSIISIRDIEIQNIRKQRQDVRTWRNEALSRPDITDSDSLHDAIMFIVRTNPRDGTLFESGSKPDTGHVKFKKRRFSESVAPRNGVR